MKLQRALTIARHVLGGLVAAAAVLALYRAFQVVVLTHAMKAAEYASAQWGALLLTSFVGWGTALNVLVFPRQRADLGLRCAWGWGVAVTVGGALCAVSLARRVVLFGFVGVGLFFFAIGVVAACVRWSNGRKLLRRRRARLLAADAPFLFGAAATASLGLIRAFAAIFNSSFNVNDDPLAYFQFAREIIERGTLTQPFSLRRISAYSGKSLLDALQLAIDVPETHLHLLDKGLATLTVLALVFGHLRSARRSGRAVVLLGMLFVVLLPDSGINSSSMRTATVFFLGLYRTLTWAPVATGRGLRAALPVALLAAGACTLRQNYLVTVGVLLIIAYGTPILRGLRLYPRPLGLDVGAVRDAAIAAGLLVVFLAPWMVLSYRWCGTFLFPMVKGNYNRDYSFFPPHKPLEWVQYVWTNASFLMPVKAVPLFLVAALTMRSRGARRPLGALLVAAFLGFAILLVGYPAGEVLDQSRYYFGFTFAAILAVVLAASDLAPQRPRPGRRWAEQAACVPLVILGLGLQIYEERDRTSGDFKGFIGQLGTNVAAWAKSSQDATFKTLQAPVPDGAPIAVMVDTPSHFDHHRNRIECLDMIGGVSPPPGIPLAAGGEAVAAYLQAKGYRYLVLINPDAAKSLYRRDIWVKQQKDSSLVWKQSAHFYLEAFDAFDKLRETRVHLAEAGSMMTLDLATMKQP